MRSAAWKRPVKGGFPPGTRGGWSLSLLLCTRSMAGRTWTPPKQWAWHPDCQTASSGRTSTGPVWIWRP
eukprot:5447381-Lingulodinium_polyedra.AAC.1